MCSCKYCIAGRGKSITSVLEKQQPQYSCAEVIANCTMLRCQALALEADKEFYKACKRLGLNPEIAIRAPLNFLTLGWARRTTATVVEPRQY